MGLDVSLKYCADRATELAKQNAASEFENAAWEKAGAYDLMSDAQKETVREAIRAYNAANDLDEYGSSNKIQGIELDSKIHPDHMFKVGYLRSSYNSGGINSVLERIGCPNLYDIFEPGDEYYATINWVQAQARAQVAIDRLREHMAGPMAQYDAIEVSGYDPVSSKEEALALFKKELGHKSPFGGGYSNRVGDFFLEGIKIVGAIPGKPTMFGGNPSYYLITKSDEPGGNFNWYFQALEVTKEMIDYVLAQPDPDNYFLSWSA